MRGEIEPETVYVQAVGAPSDGLVTAYLCIMGQRLDIL